MTRAARRLRPLLAVALGGGVLALLAACATTGSAGPTVISGRIAFPQGTTSIPCASVLPTVTVSPPASGHIVYYRTPLGPFPLQKTFHAGTTVSYEWCAYPANPQPGGNDGASAARLAETLTTAWYGPYPDRTTAASAEDQITRNLNGPATDRTPPTTPPPPAPALTSPPAHTDTWSSNLVITTVALSRTMAPGWYVVVNANRPDMPASTMPGPMNGTSITAQVLQVLAP